MATRPAFIPTGDKSNLVIACDVDFVWTPGISSSQKKKNVEALHASAKELGMFSLLEVSTKSEMELGTQLSAFNLKISNGHGEMTLESAYQGSKVFEGGHQHKEFYDLSAWAAKQSVKLETRKLIGFNFLGEEWELNPPTAFFNWLYINALKSRKDIQEQLQKYAGFTDIHFTPGKSINCQAHACALLVSLIKTNQLDAALKSKQNFIEIILGEKIL